MRHACIDIGSNTTRLLVADLDGESLRPVHELRAFTQLGNDLRDAGAISPAKLAELGEVVAHQVSAAGDAGAPRPRVVATAAIRGAGNRDEVLGALHSVAGVDVVVLSGDEEARLAFAGATRSMARDEEEVAVVDVGGGSSELALGTAGAGVREARSFLVGSGSLAHQHLQSDPPSMAELGCVRAAAAVALEELEVARPPELALAVGGSATSLRRLVGGELDRNTLERGVAQLVSVASAEAARRLDLEPDRVRLLPAGMLLLAEFCERLGSPLQIGCGGLREGVILELGSVGGGES